MEEGKDEIIKILILDEFKITLCTNSKNHSAKRCYYYHDMEKDRRRPFSQYKYTSEICNSCKRGQQCPNGDNCNYAHNSVEEMYHPSKYKTKFCSSLSSNNQCIYGDFCAFAHKESELSIPLLHKMTKDDDFFIFHFKTAWCPFPSSEGHNREECAYAHNWQDFRRSIIYYNYSHEQCKHWNCDIKMELGDYATGCPLGIHCPFSHGWKEQEYHPKLFKLKQCNSGQKCKRIYCSFYHGINDMRKEIPKEFTIVPKNLTFPLSWPHDIELLSNLNHNYSNSSENHLSSQNHDIKVKTNHKIQNSPWSINRLKNLENQELLNQLSMDPFGARFVEGHLNEDVFHTHILGKDQIRHRHVENQQENEINYQLQIPHHNNINYRIDRRLLNFLSENNQYLLYNFFMGHGISYEKLLKCSEKNFLDLNFPQDHAKYLADLVQFENKRIQNEKNVVNQVLN